MGGARRRDRGCGDRRSGRCASGPPGSRGAAQLSRGARARRRRGSKWQNVRYSASGRAASNPTVAVRGRMCPLRAADPQPRRRRLVRAAAGHVVDAGDGAARIDRGERRVAVTVLVRVPPEIAHPLRYTFPARSSTPSGVAPSGNEPHRGEVGEPVARVRLASKSSGRGTPPAPWLARCGLYSSPQGNVRRSEPLAANSHSASVGRRPPAQAQ